MFKLKYACIKDDKWYKDYKEFKLNSFTTVLVADTKKV